MSMGALAGAALEEAAADVKRVNRVWEAFAKARGYAMRPGHLGWSHAQNPRIEAKLGATTATIELVVTDMNQRTIAAATPPSPVRGHVELTPEGVGSKLAKLFGAQDLVMGHDAFDAKYVVKATSLETARALLDREACELLFGLDVSRFTYDDGAKGGSSPFVTVERPKTVENEATLEAMLKIVATMAEKRV